MIASKQVKDLVACQLKSKTPQKDPGHRPTR